MHIILYYMEMFNAQQYPQWESFHTIVPIRICHEEMNNHLEVVLWLVAACNRTYMMRTGSLPYMEIHMPIYGNVQWHNSTPSEEYGILSSQ